MAAPTKKIRLTYLWANESVMVEDFTKKISKKMTEWANEFYRMYGFELDVSPGPTVSTVPLAHKFCLTKSGGIEPDFEISGKLYDEWESKRTDLEKKQGAILSEIAVVEGEEASLPPNDITARLAVVKRIIKLYESRIKIVEDILSLNQEYHAKLILHDHERQFRVQMGWKYLTDRIGDDKRLNIVFCRFAGDTQTFGQTYSQGRSLVLISQGILLWLWPYPFIIVDIRHADNSTLAHEIVHAAGHKHPNVQKVIKDVEAYFKFKPAKAVGSLLNRIITDYENYLEYQSLFKERLGGYFDGASNDIMNYGAEGKEPSEYVLSPDDKKLLENAVFVATP